MYSQNGADELVFLDITATVEKRKTLAELVKRVAAAINIPFTVGGGISSVEDVSVLLNAGADKVSINSSAVKNPQLINELSKNFGNQCIVVAIDTRNIAENPIVHINGGRTPIEKNTIDWAKEVVERGAGEILLTSMDADGTKNGFDITITKAVTQAVTVPVIASGGAGKMEHFLSVFQEAKADAALAASIFHFREIAITELKNYLKQHQVRVR
jgi:cyclase